jgi:hypothetical protein
VPRAKRRRAAPPEDLRPILKSARDSLFKDIGRAMNEPPVWCPEQLQIPPVTLGESVSRETMSGFLGQPAACERLCIRGAACLGQTMAPPFRRRGYTLGQFMTPGGRVVAGLCVMCLRLALTNQNNEELGRFVLDDYSLTDARWVLA